MPAFPLIAYYRDALQLRSRSVGASVLQGRVPLPALPQRLCTDWDEQVREALAPGNVEPLSLPRARLRWPGYRQSLQAVSDWTTSIGLPDLLTGVDPALMVCRGARYHHDAVRYGAYAFCNLIVRAARPLDLHFPSAGLRMPLETGTVVLFDTGQPHAVLPRGASRFDAADFPQGIDDSLVFLTWEVPLQRAGLADRLGSVPDADPAMASRLRAPQLHHQGRPARLCAATGQWQ